ncbi:MAG: SRPBCC family protein [Phenylobacterium sp.]
MTSRTKVERTSERELVATRTVDGPARLVFEAWTKPELIMRWWAPASFGITFLSCETDVRTGGSYRYVFRHPASGEPMAFFGKYIEVEPNARLVWTNEEEADGAVTTVTFEEKDGKTRVVVHDLYPSKEALDGAIASGSTGGWPEQFEQLDELLASMGASA